MTQADVIESVYANLATLAKHVSGPDNRLVHEIQRDLDKLGVRTMLEKQQLAGKTINFLNRRMTSAKKARHANRQKLGAFEWLTVKLASDNHELVEQLRVANDGKKAKKS